MYLFYRVAAKCLPGRRFGRGSSYLEPIAFVTFFAALTSITVVAGVLFFLIFDSFPIFREVGGSFFLDDDWFPPANAFGALSMIYGSVFVTTLAIGISAPLAVMSAVFVSEILSPGFRFYAKASMELLAGVPSIVYGLIGIEVVNTFVMSLFGLNDGSTVLSAAIVLAIMIFPIIMTISEDALHNVPQEFRHAGQGLGLTRREVIFGTVLPRATPGILSSILLGISNAIGETMAVLLVIGSIDKMPSPIFDVLDPSTTITAKLGRNAAESMSAGLQWNAMSALGLTLFVIVAVVMFLSHYLPSVLKKLKLG